jgi:hypothetical protein
MVSYCWVGKQDVKQSLYDAGLDRAWGFQETETPRFHDGGYKKVARLSALHTDFFFFSSGPRAYAPDALQPVGVLCYPRVLDVPTFAASPSPRPCYPRDP